MSYAAQIEAGIVVQVIVGDAEWATEFLGGTWVDSAEKVGIGWTWNEQDGFRPSQPSPDCVWDDETRAWDCPPEPDPPF